MDAWLLRAMCNGGRTGFLANSPDLRDSWRDATRHCSCNEETIQGHRSDHRSKRNYESYYVEMDAHFAGRGNTRRCLGLYGFGGNSGDDCEGALRDLPDFVPCLAHPAQRLVLGGCAV